LSGQSSTPDPAQDQQAQYPRFLLNSYIGVQIGYIDFPFSNAQVQPGFHAQTVQIPHLAPRVVLLGHEFNQYFSAQITEMRPVQWVNYLDVNGDQSHHFVWMNIAGLTGKARLPLGGKWGLFGEGGLGVVTRKGFLIGSSQVVNDASYATLLYGGGVDYRLNGNWTFLGGVTVAPGKAADQQPHTLFLSGGFNYTMRTAPAIAAGNSASTPEWPKNLIQAGYITNSVGYAINNFFEKGTVPIFWSGTIQVSSGFSINYRRNLFHARRWFALDWGADVSTWKSVKNGDRFYTAAVYPAFRFPLVRTNPVEAYLIYSLAGPSLITRTTIDGLQAGKTFTFQDFMGAGVFLGASRRVTAEVRIQHYSNGNLFPQNPGITIPLGFYLGTTF